MSLQLLLQNFAEALHRSAPAFVLVFIRVSSMFVFAPLFGSGRIPKRVKMLLALTLSLGVAGGLPMPGKLPESSWAAVIGIGGEICFGLAIGMILSLVFISVQWAGEVIGQQMGLNISEVLDPQFGGAGSLIGDLYFWFAMVIFLSIRGHQMLLHGLRASFESLPVLSVGISESIVDLLLSLLTGATTLALCLAGPMLITMIVVDLALGCISKTMPQFNVMSAGLTIRAIVGVIVLIIGMSLTGNVMKQALVNAMETVHMSYGAN